MRVIQAEPHFLLGQIEDVIDRLNARVLRCYLADDDLLSDVGRLRELHHQLDASLQKQRLNDQLNMSLELAGRAPEQLRREPKP